VAKGGTILSKGTKWWSNYSRRSNSWGRLETVTHNTKTENREVMRANGTAFTNSSQQNRGGRGFCSEGWGSWV
jgi:hypothetical protein